ncbi:MAG: diaminopimelate epimerase [Candidatus Fimisoma sp.]|nr:diaminopimelate epimerase [Candidatus Fimisoma sp.]
MKFWKMNGAGNDFIIINNMDRSIAEDRWPYIARTLCQRHMSIGADGMMVVTESTGDADYRMTFFNSDGSMGEMCGNGARCIARYGYENGLAGEVQKIETTAGIIYGQRIDKRMYRVRLNDPSVIIPHMKIDVDGREYECAYVELGDPGLPHVAVPVINLREYDESELFRLGRKIRNHPEFTKGANVNFYEITGPDRIYERTYERGVEDFTYACGTGTGSVVTILTLRGAVSGKKVRVEVAGGELIIDAEREGKKIKNLYLTGPTNIVAKGEVTDEEL